MAQPLLSKSIEVSRSPQAERVIFAKTAALTPAFRHFFGFTTDAMFELDPLRQQVARQ